MRYFIGFAIVLIIISSCKKEKKQGEGLFYNDFEELFGWAEAPTLTKTEGHSGQYVSRMDSVYEYSHGLTLNFKEASNSPITTVKIKAWVMFKDADAKGQIVFQVHGPEIQNLFWSSIVLNDFVFEPNKWTEVSGQITLPEGISNPDNTLLVYGWNNSRRTILIDDLEVSFK